MNIWNLILYQPLLNLLIIFYHFLGHNMGIAIIALTLLVRLILFPSTFKSLLAQKKLKEIQPEMEKIKKDHGHDKQKMAQAQMELYKRHGVNPFSSCLPLLFQFPIFIALYQVFLKLAQTPQLNMLYSFVPRPEAINTHFLWLNLAKPDPFYILPILAGLAMFWQSKMTMPEQSQQSAISKKQPGAAGDKMQDFQKIFSKQMLYLFPLMTVFIALKLPSALALYWVVTTLFGVIQQYLIFKGPWGTEAVRAVKGQKGTFLTVRKRE